MREYLFRGKRKDNGEWIAGSLVTKVDPLLETNYCFILAQGRGESFVTWHMVDPSTVGQFTGLLDKKGKRIFEGDILERRMRTRPGKDGSPRWRTIRCVIKWRYAGFSCEKIGAKGEMVYFRSDMHIIGNIHDNPEMVEGVV